MARPNNRHNDDVKPQGRAQGTGDPLLFYASSNQIRMRAQAKIPVNRFGEPDEIASIVELLVTNAYLTNKVCRYLASLSQAFVS